MIYNLGRAEAVDREALARLVASISRFLSPEQAMVAAAGAEVEVLDSRRLGGVWVLDQVWRDLGVGAAVRRVAIGRQLDSEAVERVLFALVAQRALEPGSKLAATRWVAERVAIEGLAQGIRVVENATGDTWRTTRHELDRMHLVTLTTGDGRAAQRSAITSGQKTILDGLNLPEPPRFLEFSTADQD